MVKILVADDQPFTRSGLRNIIENSFNNPVVDEADNGTAVIDKVRVDDYNMIIMDVNIGKTTAAELVTEILGLKPETKILMFSMFNEKMYARKFLQVGAMGLLSKSSSADEIIKGIQNVLNNKKYVSSGLLQTIVHDIINDKINNPFRQLSKRELDILFYVLQGKEINEIAAELHLDHSTVGTHTARIFKKLNCNSVVDIRSLAELHNFNAILHQ